MLPLYALSLALVFCIKPFTYQYRIKYKLETHILKQIKTRKDEKHKIMHRATNLFLYSCPQPHQFLVSNLRN